ncbi:MAG: HSP20 family protein [Verrucomicrobiales bacterium]|jgi:HSP20 family protein
MNRYYPTNLLSTPFEAIVNSLLQTATGPVLKPSRRQQRSSLKLSADFFEDEGNFFARVELPGVKRDEVNLSLDGDLLTIAYEKRAEPESENSTETATYQRAIRTPEGIKPEAISAKLEDGLLILTLPKADEVKPREIAVG